MDKLIIAVVLGILLGIVLIHASTDKESDD